jgi:hypothetical protein
MAIEKGIISLSGKLDNQVHYRRNGKNFVRSNPGHYTLSENSQKSGTEFGRAGSAASLVRKALGFMADRIADNGFYNRLSAHFYQVIKSCNTKQPGERQVVDGDLALLKKVELNRYTHSQKIFPAEPVVIIHPEADIFISLPRLGLAGIARALPQAGTLVVQLCCCACDFAAKKGVVAKVDDLPISLQQSFFPGCKLKLPAGALDDKVLLITIGFYCLDKNAQLIGNRKYMAGRMIEAVLIREGRIVPFVYPENKIQPVVKQKEKKGVSWEINQEPGD